MYPSGLHLRDAGPEVGKRDRVVSEPSQTGTRMQISHISSIDEFDKLRDTWDAVYSADQHATIHRSWAWLRGWMESTPYNPFVLAVRQNTGSPYVSFVVLGLEPNTKDGGKLYLGGYPFSAHTGFVCLPEYAEEVIPTLSAFIQKGLEWDRFEIRDAFDPRLDTFLKCFSPRKFSVHRINRTPAPYTPLPKSWDQYLQDFLGGTTCRMLKYKLRRIERETNLRETEIQPDNLESQIATLLTLWQGRWGRKSEQSLNQWRAIMRCCFESNSLWLTILWDEMTPLAGMAAYLDQQKKTFSYFMSGYNDKYAKLSPGAVMLVRSIQYAIENGFLTYDFGRGADNYKFKYGAKQRFNTNVIIVRKNLRTKVKNQISRLKNYRYLAELYDALKR